ncbi:methyl-accepting chemotaxis protein [uncultured Brachyspira sp.]|uniref:methyl-accepting chemotaxis protein n=1 Tax=uncultured Brachyspira sp. TaxID=221953 RepID=UPI0026376539|nr:methyl-accepting chemotaxis protein [uncultured Brachyspira sp.]
MIKKFSLQIKISLAILVPLLVMLIISNTINVLYVKNANKKLSYKILEESSKGEAAKLQSFMEDDLYYTIGLQKVIEGFYSDGMTNRVFYETTVYNFFTKLSQNVNAIFIGFEPNALDNDSNYTNSQKYGSANGRFNYYVQRNGADNFKESYFDSKVFGNLSYTQPLNTGEVYITDVYNDMLYTWGIPIKNGNKVIGVICLDIISDSVNNLLSKIKLFEGTTVTLFDNSGTIVYDSDKSSYRYKSIDEIYPYYAKHDVFNKIKSGQNLIFESFSGTLKKYYTYSFTPLELSKGRYWGLKITAPNDVILKDSNIIRNIMIIISFLIVVISSIIVPIITKRKVVSMIGIFSKSMSRISNGDISFHVSEKFLNMNDEWGDIAKSLERILSNLNKVVRTVKNSAEQVSTAANQVLAGNNDLSQRTESQASSLEETAASMNQMASAIKESAESVAESTSIVSDAKESLNKAGITVEETVNKMNDVHEASTKIMDITKLIENIAFQTNILALNASVEAARAGEQGRGFAVVASEVRNLAQNTQESVKNITALIIDSNEKTNLAADSVKNSKEMFEDISLKMDSASSMMDKINIASQEQQKGIEQVDSAISNMDSSVQKNAALVEEATAASQSLLNEASELIEAIGYFKLRN